MAFRIKHKFGAKQTEIDGKKFSSKKEASYYKNLKIRQKVGEIIFFLRQVGFDLPGGVRYFIDFVEFHAPKNGDQGDVIFTEVKGFPTPVGSLKIKMTEDLYGIKINII